MKIVTSMMLALLPTAAAAAVGEQPRLQRVTADGMQLEYTIKRDAKGREVLAGHEQTTGKRFRFVVTKGWVRGEVEGRPVAFHVSEAEREAPTARRAGR